MNAQLNLPSGYWLEYGGTFEQLQSASKRLSLVVPVTLLLIFGLLYSFVHQLTREDVVWTYSGVRPLCDDESDSPQAITRDYTLATVVKSLMPCFQEKPLSFRL